MQSSVMRAGAADGGESRLTTDRSRTYQPSAKFFRLSQLRRLRGCEQVAAVCYRVRGSGVEFLLVRTGSGHWTFPKGSAEPGLTHAQAAALEAFEEAGVHGRMEEVSFTRYVRRKGGRTRNSARSGERSAVKEIAIQAHLCEVSRLDPPQERNRNPTWFSADKAKRRLREDRTPDFGAELARVVDRAITRIRRLRSEAITTKDRPQKDAMLRVQFIDRIPTAAGRTKALKTG
jgi:8-oxo-dGTP pyrophosphatase MutT (NUDIX family)